MSEKVLIEMSLAEQLEDISLEIENIKNQIVFLKRSSQGEDISNLADDYLEMYSEGRTNILESLENKLNETHNRLLDIVIALCKKSKEEQ